MSATNVNRNALHYLMNREATNVQEFKSTLERDKSVLLQMPTRNQLVGKKMFYFTIHERNTIKLYAKFDYNNSSTSLGHNCWP